MPNKSSNKVHLMYLPLLAYLMHAGHYNWGSACLATLYREICRAMLHTHVLWWMCTTVTILGMVRLSFIAPLINCEPTYPLAQR